MSIKRLMAAASVAALLPLTAAEGAALADTPPPTGCAAQILPGKVLILAGTEVWGAQHGVARVHSTVWVDPPRVPDGMQISYTWKVGTSYTIAGNHLRFPWAAYGKGVMLKLLVSGTCGDFTQYYFFGVVGLPV
jgi:hypothetical protein